jgi:ABC-type phosphate transport system substrate-binding protein
LFTFLLGACGEEEKKQIRIKGDDVGHFIFENFLQQYNAASPAVNFTFSGGGSQTALHSLLDTTTKIVFSLKKLNNEDRALLKTQNIYPVEIPLVKIPIIVIGNQAIPLNQLSYNQVKRIFSGFHRYWWQLLPKSQRKDQPGAGVIDYCSLDSRNGEHFFFHTQLNLVDYNIDTRYFNHNLALLEYVARNKTAVGYISLPFFTDSERIKVLFTDEQTEATGYLIMDQSLEANETIQGFLYQLKTYLYQNQILLLQKGIKMLGMGEDNPSAEKEDQK